jgi:hypothetical protein
LKAILLSLLILFTISCNKEGDPNDSDYVCVDCIEMISLNTEINAYCGTNQEADLFISEKKKEGGDWGEVWVCTKR